jgi:hypothetical protein
MKVKIFQLKWSRLSLVSLLVFFAAGLTIIDWHWSGIGITVFLLTYVSKGIRRSQTENRIQSQQESIENHFHN